eukprot:9058066-Pyramimonas_sp.AAC.1
MWGTKVVSQPLRLEGEGFSGVEFDRFCARRPARSLDRGPGNSTAPGARNREGGGGIRGGTGFDSAAWLGAGPLMLPTSVVASTTSDNIAPSLTANSTASAIITCFCF